MKIYKNLYKLVSLVALSVTGASILASCQSGNETAPIYTINFYAEGSNTQLSPIKAKAGEAIAAPINPSRSGYTFVDWHENYHGKISGYKHTDEEKAFDFSKGMPAHNVTLYAHFEKSGGSSATEEEVDRYMESLKESSQANHLYYHYYRYGNAGYDDWDVWAWPTQPEAAEGHRFDWKGRTTAADYKSATGTATFDAIAGACIDIDLSLTYDSGWDKDKMEFQKIPMSFADAEQVGLQIVRSSSRFSDSGFWVNDSGQILVDFRDYAIPVNGGGESYHIFAVQDNVKQFRDRPVTSVVNPFDDDDGTTVTYGNAAYDNVDWSKSIPDAPTAGDFTTVGAGYQIQVSSFADSDGDGFGDILGITQKIDYIADLGVKALWLTPIQLSDSYHGYDITDYKKVDPKFGSKNSPHVQNGAVTSESAMEDYKDLIAACNNRGIKVVMDLVLNHTSTANNWFTDSANLSETYRGFYQWGNHETNAGAINEDKYWYPYGDHEYSYYAKFGSGMPELNYSYQATRDAVEDMSAYWVNEVGVSGFRLDAVKHIYMLDEAEVRDNDTIIVDESTVGGRKVSYSSNLTKNLNFFKQLKASVAAKTGKDVFFVGENFDGHAYHVAPYYEAFDSMFDFYAYFNLTSAAATGKAGTTSKFGTGKSWMQGSGTFNAGQVSTNAQTGNKSGDARGVNVIKNSSNESLIGTVPDGNYAAGGDFSIVNGDSWGFQNVYNAYNKYRRLGGGSSSVALPGAFTSNHDIARVVNRIAGTEGNAIEGIKAQGNITESTFPEFNTSAMLVKIAEIMLPGVTWIYYGDEIGMTGNFPEGKTAQSDYADLYYRQPMKWATTGNEKGDANGFTDYHVTGSKMEVVLDEVNASSVVEGALSQHDRPGSDYNILKAFIEKKNQYPAKLVSGDIAFGQWCWGDLEANTLCFSRGGDAFRVVINFSNQPANINSDNPFGNYNVIASYNGATKTSIPAFSAMLLQRS